MNHCSHMWPNLYKAYGNAKWRICFSYAKNIYKIKKRICEGVEQKNITNLILRP